MPCSQAVADHRRRPQDLSGHVVHLRQVLVPVLLGEELPLPAVEQHRPAADLPLPPGRSCRPRRPPPGPPGPGGPHLGGFWPWAGSSPAFGRLLEEGLRLLPGGEALEQHPHPFTSVSLGPALVPALPDAVTVPAVFHRVVFLSHGPPPSLVRLSYHTQGNRASPHPANRGVDKYRSPVSGRSTAAAFSRNSGRAAAWQAAHRAAPEEIPTKIPSVLAKSLAAW